MTPHMTREQHIADARNIARMKVAARIDRLENGDAMEVEFEVVDTDGWADGWAVGSAELPFGT